jgi:hypothetical protein
MRQSKRSVGASTASALGLPRTSTIAAISCHRWQLRALLGGEAWASNRVEVFAPDLKPAQLELVVKGREQILHRLRGRHRRSSHHRLNDGEPAERAPSRPSNSRPSFSTFLLHVFLELAAPSACQNSSDLAPWRPTVYLLSARRDSGRSGLRRMVRTARECIRTSCRAAERRRRAGGCAGSGSSAPRRPSGAMRATRCNNPTSADRAGPDAALRHAAASVKEPSPLGRGTGLSPAPLARFRVHSA